MTDDAKFPIELKKTNERIYTIIGNGTISPHSKYKIVFCLHDDIDCDKRMEIKFTLRAFDFEVSKFVKVQPMKIKNIEFEVADLADRGDYRLIVEGIKGLEFREIQKLHFQACLPIIYIQTDKMLYKQGDLLKFRGIFLNENMQAYAFKKPFSISLISGRTEKKLQKEWLKVEPKNGVFFGTYKISENPAYGFWSIEVFDGYQCLATETFEIEKYFLTKYDLKIETASDVLITAGVINIKVQAQRKDSKTFKGKVTISLRSKHGWSTGMVLATKTINIVENGDVQFEINEEMKKRCENALEVVAEFKSSFFDRTELIAKDIILHKQRFKFEILKYESGKIAKLKIAVKHYDGKPMTKDKEDKVTMKVKTIFGHVEDLSDISMSTNLDENEQAYFEAMLPLSNENLYHIIFEYLDSQGAFICSNADDGVFDGENSDTMRLYNLTNSPQLGKPIELLLKTNSTITAYVYAIVAHGKLLKAELVTTAAADQAHMLKFDTKFEMMPSFAVLVYYIEHEKLHYQELTVKLEETLQNFLSIDTSPTALVGSKTALEIQTEPSSYVGIMSTNRMGENGIQMQKIFQQCKRYEAAIDEEMCLNSGIFVLTNALEYKGGDQFNWPPKSYIEPDKECSIDLIPQKWQPVKPRQKHFSEFPKSWLFEDFESGSDGKLIIERTTPDTPATWHISGFSMNDESGLGLMDKTINVITTEK